MFKKDKSGIGIEVSDVSIKVLELKYVKGKKIVTSQEELKIEQHIVAGGVIKKPQNLARAIKQIFKKAGLGSPNGKLIHFALPNNLVYTHVFRADIGVGQSINKIIRSEYQRTFPFSFQSGEYAFKVTSQDDSSNHQMATIVLVATEKKYLLLWQDFFESQKIKIEFFDIGVLALFRGIFDKYQKETIAILDIKNNFSNFSVFSSHGLIYHAYLHINKNSSEKDFKTLVDKNISKIKKERKNLKVDTIIISGDIDEVFYKNLRNLDSRFELKKSVLVGEKVESKYFQTLGLAKRSLGHYWEQNNPFLPCIGHVYSLKSKQADKKKIVNNIFLLLKKYIVILLAIFVLLGLSWWFMGTAQTSLESDKNEVKEEFKQEVKKSALPLYMQEEQKKEKVYVKVKQMKILLNVRSGPGTKNKIIGQISPGSEQILLEKHDGWDRIEWPNKKEAWVSAKYIINKK